MAIPFSPLKLLLEFTSTLSVTDNQKFMVALLFLKYTTSRHRIHFIFLSTYKNVQDMGMKIFIIIEDKA